MTINVNMTAKSFRAFTIFDVLRRRKMWRSPAIFASILGTAAIICFIMHHVRGAVFLGCTLTLVGLGMPLVYFATFFSSLCKQCVAYGLSRPQHVYTLELDPGDKNIHITNEKEKVDLPWKNVFHVYRTINGTYLYATPQKAFLMPHSCVEEGNDALWELLCKKIPAERRTDYIKNK